MSTNAIRSAGTVVRYVKESTAGTDPGSWTITLAALGAHLQKKQARTARQTLYQGSGGLVQSGFIDGRTEVPWSASHYMTYKGMGLLLSLLLGDAATSGSGPYTHTWDLEKDPKTATIGVVEGQGLGSLSTQRHEGHGCVVTSATLRAEAHGNMQLDLEGFGMSADAPAGAAGITVTNAAYMEVHGHHAGTLAWNGINYGLISLELTIPNGQVFRDALGSGGTLRPYSVNLKDVQLRVVMEKVGDAFVTGNQAGTSSDAVITFTDPVNSHTLAITIHNAIAFDTDGGRKEGFSLIQETVIFKPQQDASDTGVSVVIVNDQASAEAA
tara:strand:- start:543 stop:1520 length:978 start_codon:yes stop_codon:yes gene_type:complete